MDWFPTFMTAAGNPNMTKELLQGKTINGTNYKVHLDGYDQTAMITGKGPSNRNEIWYFAESSLNAVRLGDYKFILKEQPDGWIGDTVTPGAPPIINLRLDPFERTAWAKGNVGSYSYLEWYKYQFWRFVQVQDAVVELAKSAIEFPPMQKGASFTMEAVVAQIKAAAAKHGQ
jgi:arylsulfatase